MWNLRDFDHNSFIFQPTRTENHLLVSLVLERRADGRINYDTLGDDFNRMVYEHIYREVSFSQNLSIVTPRFEELSTYAVQLILRDLATAHTISYGHEDPQLHLGSLSFANVEELIERKNNAINSGEAIDITSIEILIMVIYPTAGASGYRSFDDIPLDVRKYSDPDQGRLEHHTWIRQRGINCAAFCLAVIQYLSNLTQRPKRNRPIPENVLNLAREIQAANNWQANQYVSRDNILIAFENFPALRKPARLTVIAPPQIKCQSGSYYTRKTPNFTPTASGTNSYYMILHNRHWIMTPTPREKFTSLYWCHVCCSYYNNNNIQDPNNRAKKVKPCRCNLPEKKKRPLQTKDSCSCPHYHKTRNHRCFLYSNFDADKPRVFRPYIPTQSTHHDNHLFAYDLESMIVEGEGMGDYFVTNNHRFTFDVNGNPETQRIRRCHHVVNAISIKDVFSDFKMYFYGEEALDTFLIALAEIPGCLFY